MADTGPSFPTQESVNTVPTETEKTKPMEDQDSISDHELDTHDKAPLLRAMEDMPPAYPSSVPTQQSQQVNVTVVTTQPTMYAAIPQPPNLTGYKALVGISVFTTLCCGIIPGLVALILSWEALHKKERGHHNEAKAYSLGAVFLNIISVLLGIGAIVGASVYYSIKFNEALSNSRYGY